MPNCVLCLLDQHAPELHSRNASAPPNIVEKRKGTALVLYLELSYLWFNGVLTADVIESTVFDRSVYLLFYNYERFKTRGRGQKLTREG